MRQSPAAEDKVQNGPLVFIGSAGLKSLAIVAIFTIAVTSLTACSGGSEPSGGKTSSKPSKPEAPKEPPLVTDEEISRYVDAEPDTKVAFPEAEFKEAHPYIFTQNKPGVGVEILKKHLDDAVKAQAGQTKLGQYCTRLGIGLWMQGGDKCKESMKYFLLAQRIFYKQPQEKRPMPNWFFNCHLYPGLYYNGQRKWAEAEQDWRKCINIAAGAPINLISKEWRKISLQQLHIALVGQGKTVEAKAVQEQLKKM
jgi:hypothetical protein